MSQGHVEINTKTVAMLIVFLVVLGVTIAFFYWLHQVWML